MPSRLYSVLDTYPRRRGAIREPRQRWAARDDRPALGATTRATEVACVKCGTPTGNMSDAICLACERGEEEQRCMWLAEVAEWVENPPAGVVLENHDIIGEWAQRARGLLDQLSQRPLDL